jgi:NAD(P)H-hydrate epimerase
MQLVTAREMQQMDRETISSFGIPGRVLMESAGRGVYQTIVEQFETLNTSRVGILAGRGNNGGDGFVVARYLAQRDVATSVYLLSSSQRLEGDAADNFNLLADLDVTIFEMPAAEEFERQKARMALEDIWVDALLGTGLNSDVRGYFKAAIEFINQLEKPVVAVDMPSGLHADTGQPCGVCIQARTTVTFAFAKIGLALYPGVELAGDLKIIDIGIPRHIALQAGSGQYLATPAWAASKLAHRAADTHKGHTGHVLVVAGSTGKSGAAAMAAMAAVRAGAGLVTLAIPDSLNALMEPQVTEAMTVPLPDNGKGILDAACFDRIQTQWADKNCVALGPGLGTADTTRRLVADIVNSCSIPLVIDADGVNSLAGQTDTLKRAQAPVVLTPHPGEMARLTGQSVAAIQADRVTAARRFARAHDVTVVLKGARTVTARPNGKVIINPTGNAGMASGGMGDVLTGLVAGLIAQGYPAEIAAAMGAYIHGAAADTLHQNTGPFGYLATEVMNGIPQQLQQLYRLKTVAP